MTTVLDWLLHRNRLDQFTVIGLPLLFNIDRGFNKPKADMKEVTKNCSAFSIRYRENKWSHMAVYSNASHCMWEYMKWRLPILEFDCRPCKFSQTLHPIYTCYRRLGFAKLLWQTLVAYSLRYSAHLPDTLRRHPLLAGAQWTINMMPCCQLRMNRISFHLENEFKTISK